MEPGESLGFTDRDPFATLVLPEWEEAEQPSFSVDEIRRIIQAAKPPYDTVFWLVAQTGIRRGEVCALNIADVNLDFCVITVRRSRSGKHITNTKSRRARVFPISPRLAERLRTFVVGRPTGDALFLTAEGKRLHPDNFVKRHLTPILDALGIPRAGLHAFRHGNATAQDTLAVPLKTRQERLGHVNTRTTMDYTHLLGKDGRRVPVQLDDLFCPAAAEVLVQDGRVM